MQEELPFFGACLFSLLFVCLSSHLHCAKFVSKRLLAHLTSLIDIPSKQAPQKYLNEDWSARASSPFRILLEADTYEKELLTRNRDIQESASSANNGTEQY